MSEFNCNEVWGRCLAIIRDNIPEASFKTWFSPIKPVSLEGSVITVEVPSDFVKDYIESNYLDLLSKALRREIGPSAKLIYKIRITDGGFLREGQKQQKPYTNREISAPGVAQTYNGNPYLIPGLKRLNIDPQLNPVYTMANFVEGDCNRLARAAGMSIAANPGRNSFNPLFIYGGPGLGKTHLSQAIGIAIKERYPDKVVLYVNANTFLNQYMNASCAARQGNNSNQVADFLRYYQLVDVLILDDVQEFAEKKGTQQAFFHIFNYLHQSGKQLILTSDRPPVELKGLEQRLLSRFKWGISAELLPPSYETRLEILKVKSVNEGVEIPEEVLAFVARKVKSNIRELEGILFSLIANATFNKRDITLSLAADLVEKIVSDHKTEISVSKIQTAVCNYFNITTDQFMSKTRKREIVQARQIAMYLSRNLTKTSLASIGAQLGGKDHATVLHACNTVCDLMDTDRGFRGYVNDIEKQLTSAD